MRFALAAIMIASAPGVAQAADICKALALHDVPAVEDPGSIIRKGEYDTSVTQYTVDKKTGTTAFCSHGGYCYPTHIVVGGKKVEALRLTNCKINRSQHDDIGDEVIYGLDVIRSRVSLAELRRDDLENRLVEMGLCSACAGNVAEVYLKRPRSRCAMLTKQALEGNPAAIKTLRETPAYCTAWR